MLSLSKPARSLRRCSRRVAAVGLILMGLAGFQPAQAAPVREPYPPAPAPIAPPLYDPAPWWARLPIIAATGEVQTHVPANRGRFSAQVSVVDPSLAEATRQVAERVRTLAQTLAAYGADKVQVETSLSVTPIYQQYRDKQGELQTNERADRIERYEASVRFQVEVRDIAVVARAYAAVASAHPASIQPVFFSLEPDNELNTALFRAAVADAARRARLAGEAAGARIGRVLLIDPTARACETDVLVAGAPRTFGDDAGGVQEVVVTANRRAKVEFAPMAAPPPPPPPPPPAPGAEPAPEQILPLQPPLETLTRKACVIYALE